MKSLLLAMSLIAASFLSATEVHFQIDPYSGVSFDNAAGKEHAKIFDGGKFGETVLLDSKLKKTGENTYSSPKGTVLTVKKLSKPEVKHEGLRHEFTATWMVTLSGKGEEFDEVLETLAHAKDPKNPKTITIYGYEAKK